MQKPPGVLFTQLQPPTAARSAALKTIAKRRGWERQHFGDKAADRRWTLVFGRHIGIALVDGVALPALGQMDTHLVNQRGAHLWHVASP